jgi:GGDEF domain-containing protein
LHHAGKTAKAKGRFRSANTNPSGALNVARQSEEELDRLAIPHATSPTAAHVTVSFGLVTMGRGFQGSDSLIVEKADEQLYAAKPADATGSAPLISRDIPRRCGASSIVRRSRPVRDVYLRSDRWKMRSAFS